MQPRNCDYETHCKALKAALQSHNSWEVHRTQRCAVCQPQCRSITCLNYLPWHSINKGFPSAAVIYLYWSSIKHLIHKLQIGLLQGVPNNNRPVHGYALWILVSSHGWTGGQEDKRSPRLVLLPSPWRLLSSWLSSSSLESLVRGFPRVAAEAAPHPVQCGPLSLQPGIHFFIFSYFCWKSLQCYNISVF